MRVAGAYWRGKEGTQTTQRLYGVAFATKEELNNDLHMLEEAKKRDHRKLGQKLDLSLCLTLWARACQFLHLVERCCEMN